MAEPRSSYPTDSPLVLGKIIALFGVLGWVKIFSHTRPREAIFDYRPWLLKTPPGEWQTVNLTEHKLHGKGLVARFEGCHKRDQAAALLEREIAIWPSQLSDLPNGEYYWHELEGLKVINQDNESLGVVDHLLETGANDVLVVTGERERLIPHIPDVVKSVDLEAGEIRVEWDQDF